MFDSEIRADESPRQPHDDDIDQAVRRLVAAFGGGELVTDRPEKAQPLSAA